MQQLEKGQEVYCSDGERLGRILALTEHALVIEKGFFLPTDFTCRRSDVMDVRDGQVRLSRTKKELKQTAGRTDLSREAATAGRELTAAGAQAMAEAAHQEIPGSGEEDYLPEQDVDLADDADEDRHGRAPGPGEGDSPHA